jgi:acyl-CoA reductase-like NAD-dependent aldehyde dehydrogenase
LAPVSDLVCISPIDGREYARRPIAPDGAIEQALSSARAAQRDWAAAPLEERCRIVSRFIQVMEELNDEIVPELAWQMGRPVRYGGELGSLVERVNGMLGLAGEALAPLVAEPGRRYVTRVPAGLVLVIAPWNYPFLTAANTIVPALAANRARGGGFLHQLDARAWREGPGLRPTGRRPGRRSRKPG